LHDFQCRRLAIIQHRLQQLEPFALQGTDIGPQAIHLPQGTGWLRRYLDLRPPLSIR
jgi:hypothetical protein